MLSVTRSFFYFSIFFFYAKLFTFSPNFKGWGEATFWGNSALGDLNKAESTIRLEARDGETVPGAGAGAVKGSWDKEETGVGIGVGTGVWIGVWIGIVNGLGTWANSLNGAGAGMRGEAVAGTSAGSIAGIWNPNGLEIGAESIDGARAGFGTRAETDTGAGSIAGVWNMSWAWAKEGVACGAV